MGATLIPDEVTTVLGVKPSYSCLKGDRVPGFPIGHLETVAVGIWLIKATDREPEDFDGQVQEILSCLPSDLEVWAELGRQYKLDLFCGLFMRNDNEGFLLSPQTLLSLGERGINLDGDIYAP